MTTNNSSNNIASASLLTGSTLASGVTGSSLTSVGTISSGTWSASFGAVSGANLTNLTAANISSGTAGINISGNAGTVTNGVYTTDTGTVTNTMLAGSIANNKLVNSSFTVGSTSISLGATATTLAGLVSVTSTTFIGALTGNSSTATALQTARTINGVSFDGTANITIATGELAWNTTTGTSATLAAGNGYFANNASLITYTLPTTAAVGDTFVVSWQGAGGWAIAQNSGQTIRLGNVITTTGTGGSLASSDAGDTVTIVCKVANTGFQVISPVGNITVV